MPSNNLQFTLRSGLTMGSLFTGASIVHYLLKPDLVRREAPSTHKCGLLALHVCQSDVLALRILGLLISQTVPDLATAAAAAKREAEGFVAATTFSGAKPGFIFKADVAGLGYYPDSSATK